MFARSLVSIGHFWVTKFPTGLKTRSDGVLENAMQNMFFPKAESLGYLA